jgi:YesN/AraC family two-component response regulator
MLAALGLCLICVTGMTHLGAAAPKPKVLTRPLLELSPQQINQIMDFLKATEPDVYKKAEILRQSDPRQFAKLITEAAPNFARLERLRKTDPKLLHLTLQDLADTHESFKLAGELRQPGLPPSAMQLLRTRLRQVVTAQFDLRQQIRLHELNELVKKINELKAQLKHRETRRLQIIQRRMTELIGKPPSVNW